VLQVPVLLYIKSIAINIEIEPTTVYIKNRKAALIFREREPYNLIIKNIGIKTLSKKI